MVISRDTLNKLKVGDRVRWALSKEEWEKYFPPGYGGHLPFKYAFTVTCIHMGSYTFEISSREPDAFGRVWHVIGLPYDAWELVGRGGAELDWVKYWQKD